MPGIRSTTWNRPSASAVYVEPAGKTLTLTKMSLAPARGRPSSSTIRPLTEPAGSKWTSIGASFFASFPLIRRDATSWRSFCSKSRMTANSLTLWERARIADHEPPNLP